MKAPSQKWITWAKDFFMRLDWSLYRKIEKRRGKLRLRDGGRHLFLDFILEGFWLHVLYLEYRIMRAWDGQVCLCWTQSHRPTGTCDFLIQCYLRMRAPLPFIAAVFFSLVWVQICSCQAGKKHNTSTKRQYWPLSFIDCLFWPLAYLFLMSTK